ncbi:hypothetical protein HK097_010580 [Rhizophlyctis rosea]|uniref:Uncharacterized protein n=1 Tax=Rhizophlyctis rosea TaxID=64517 RepID=A0AAD5SLA0_9FUNG|nr:hypothetical protein HK097_010580 [Rhizophlyctis rosea]
MACTVQAAVQPGMHSMIPVAALVAERTADVEQAVLGKDIAPVVLDWKAGKVQAQVGTHVEDMVAMFVAVVDKKDKGSRSVVLGGRVEHCSTNRRDLGLLLGVSAEEAVQSEDELADKQSAPTRNVPKTVYRGSVERLGFVAVPQHMAADMAAFAEVARKQIAEPAKADTAVLEQKEKRHWV